MNILGSPRFLVERSNYDNENKQYDSLFNFFKLSWLGKPKPLKIMKVKEVWGIGLDRCILNYSYNFSLNLLKKDAMLLDKYRFNLSKGTPMYEPEHIFTYKGIPYVEKKLLNISKGEVYDLYIPLPQQDRLDYENLIFYPQFMRRGEYSFSTKQYTAFKNLDELYNQVSKYFTPDTKISKSVAFI